MLVLMCILYVCQGLTMYFYITNKTGSILKNYHNLQVQIGKLCKSLLLKYIKHTVLWTYENLSIKTFKLNFFETFAIIDKDFPLLLPLLKLKISDKMFSDLFEFERDWNTYMYVRSIIYTCTWSDLHNT